MSFAHQQVGECKISDFFGDGGRNCGRGLEGGGAAGPGMLKLSNSSLVFLHKALPFSFTHFWDAWNHCMPAECLTFPASAWWGADQCSLLLCLEPRLSLWMETSPVKVRGSWEDLSPELSLASPWRWCHLLPHGEGDPLPSGLGGWLNAGHPTLDRGGDHSVWVTSSHSRGGRTRAARQGYQGNRVGNRGLWEADFVGSKGRVPLAPAGGCDGNTSSSCGCLNNHMGWLWPRD